LSHFNKVSGLVALSDVLISVPANKQSKGINLPFREGAIIHSSYNYTPHDFAQKMIIFGKTIIMWADSYIVARELIARVYKTSKAGTTPLTIDEIKSAYGPDQNDLNQCSFIYHYFSDIDEPYRFGWRCDSIDESQFNILAAGSGVKNYLAGLNYTEKPSR